MPALVAASLNTPLLTRLAPREQEVATLVYLNSEVTAKEVGEGLSTELSNSAIRCMLNRLVAKGVLKRRMPHGKTFVYSPAALLPEVQERALDHLADEYFGGSLDQVMRRLMTLLHKREPDVLNALSREIMVAAAGSFPRHSLAAAG